MAPLHLRLPTVALAASLSLYSLFILRRSTPAGAHPGLTERVPYPPDAFPGGRSVETSYGRIQVFEWGPEDGDKVLVVHGMSTPSIAMGDMAWELVRRGCRVMLFDLFGRGYSDGPDDLPYDERLYSTQVLLVLASSPLPWTGAAAFHLVGYSLGGSLVVAFAAHHHAMLRSLTAICPAGIARRPARLDFAHRLLLWLPGPLVGWLLRRSLRPVVGDDDDDEGEKNKEEKKNDQKEEEEAPLHWDLVACSAGSPWPRIGDVMQWQFRANGAYLGAYMSTYACSPMYDQHERSWRRLGEVMARNRDRRRGLASLCLVLADRDALLPRDECVEDAVAVLGERAVDLHVLGGTHSIVMTRGKEVAAVACEAWRGQAHLL